MPLRRAFTRATRDFERRTVTDCAEKVISAVQGWKNPARRGRLQQLSELVWQVARFGRHAAPVDDARSGGTNWCPNGRGDLAESTASTVRCRRRPTRRQVTPVGHGNRQALVMRKSRRASIDAMLRHLASHHDPQDFPSTAYERQALIETAGKRRLIEWQKDRRRYELTPNGWRRLRRNGGLGLPAL